MTGGQYVVNGNMHDGLQVSCNSASKIYLGLRRFVDYATELQLLHIAARIAMLSVYTCTHTQESYSCLKLIKIF